MIPTFSVIVPCYNQGQYLSDALNSLLAQTYTKWECIIINDNSPDDTEQIAKRYTCIDNRFKYLFVNGKGVSVARNAGISVSTGIYILPLDADDKIAPFYLEKALFAFSNDPELALLYGEAEFFGDLTGSWKLPNYSFYGLLFMNMIYCSAIFKRTDFFRVGGFSDEMVHGHEDWDLWLRLLKDGAKVMKLPEVVFYYRRKLISRSSEVRVIRNYEQTQKQLLERNKEAYFQNLPTILKELEQCKSARIEAERRLDLIKNSRTYKFLSKIKSFKSRILFF